MKITFSWPLDVVTNSFLYVWGIAFGMRIYQSWLVSQANSNSSAGVRLSILIELF